MSYRLFEHELREVTPELLSALQSHATGWIANALATKPIAAERMVPAVHSLYAAAGLEQPRVAIVSSPLAMAFAAGFAAAIWWARKNPVQAIGTGLAWAPCYVPRASPLQWTRQASRSPLADAIWRATELATQPYSEKVDLEGSAPGKNVTCEAFRSVASDSATDSAAGKAIERAARDTCAWAGPAVRETLAKEVVHNTQEQLVTPDAQAFRDAARAIAHRAMALTEDHENKNVSAALHLFGEDGPSGDTPWGQFLPWKRAFCPGEAIESILERQRGRTRVALEAASQPTDLLAGLAMLAYDLGADHGVDHLLLLHCAVKVSERYQDGNMTSALENHLGALCDMLRMGLPEHEQFRAWETCAIEGSPRFVHEEFCIVCDRPEVLKVDDQGRPHCADGPSHRWRDGWSFYHWHGIRIPPDRAYIIDAPEQITVAAIEEEQNAELRRMMIERYGVARHFVDTGAFVVHELPSDFRVVGLRSARLLRKNAEDGRGEPTLYVDLLNSTPEPDGTVKRYLLRVDPHAYGGDASLYVRAAVASTWRNADGSLMFRYWMEYEPDAES